MRPFGFGMYWLTSANKKQAILQIQTKLQVLPKVENKKKICHDSNKENDNNNATEIEENLPPLTSLDCAASLKISRISEQQNVLQDNLKPPPSLPGSEPIVSVATTSGQLVISPQMI